MLSCLHLLTKMSTPIERVRDDVRMARQENRDMGRVSHTQTTLKSIRRLRARLRPRMRSKSRRVLLHAWIGAAALLALGTTAAHANVLISIDKSTQQMLVSVDGVPRYRWAVSTGRAGYGTPSGTYRPQRMERSWFSKLYYNSPMPYSIFFHGGYAIHGSYEINRLGGPASHGCIRLHPSNAAKLFSLVRQEGVGNTTIVVSGSNPPGHREVEEAEARPRAPRYAPPGTWWGYNRPYSGDGRWSYPNPSSRGWFGG